MVSGSTPVEPKRDLYGPILMCGIVGIVDLAERGIAKPALERMCSHLTHRGPDESGYFTNHEVGFRPNTAEYNRSFDRQAADVQRGRHRLGNL